MRGPKVRLRGLSEIATNPPPLILAEQLSGRSSLRLILEIDIRKRLPGAVLHDEGACADICANVLD